MAGPMVDLISIERLTSAPAAVGKPGKIIDQTGLDGCGFMIRLDSGEVLEAKIPEEFRKPGLKVLVTYEPFNGASICMAGTMVTLSSIKLQADAPQTDTGKITGKVTLEMFGAGSHSASKRTFITTDAADRYQLRKEGENPFELPKTKLLVGKRVECKGTLQGDLFIYKSCKKLH